MSYYLHKPQTGPERLVEIIDYYDRFLGEQAASHRVVIKDVLTGEQKTISAFDIDYSVEYNEMEVIAWAAK
jgi:hypothetical protein